MASLPKGCAEIALASIGDQHDDTPGFFPRDRDGRYHGTATGHAAEDAFLPREAPGHGDRVVSTDDALHGIEGWKHMPTAIRPAIWDERVADVHMTQATDEAIAMTRRLARDEGILTGPSGGAAVAAAIRVAREEPGRIVVLIADGGERYLSTPLWEI